MVSPIAAAIFSAGMAFGLCLGLFVNFLVPPEPRKQDAKKAGKGEQKKATSFLGGSFIYFAIIAVVVSVVVAAYMRDPVYELRGGKDILVAKKKTKFQRLVATKYEVARGIFDYRLFLDGFLQFSSIDEHRYHEALVHPAFMALVSLVSAWHCSLKCVNCSSHRERIWLSTGMC